jgi:hypothetical protein
MIELLLPGAKRHLDVVGRYGSATERITPDHQSGRRSFASLRGAAASF